jgi:hypothetical protein
MLSKLARFCLHHSVTYPSRRTVTFFKKEIFSTILVLIFLVFHDLSYLWHGRHVNDIAPPGPEHVALGERRESGPLQRDHGALAVHGETQFVAGVDHDLAGTLAERRAHGDVADAAKGALSVAGLIVESLGRGNYVTLSMCMIPMVLQTYRLQKSVKILIKSFGLIKCTGQN